MDGAPATGRLLLVPNALDLGLEAVPLADVLAAGVIAQAAALRHWVVEDARSARAFLNRVHRIVPLAAPLQLLDIVELPRPRKGPGAPPPDDAVPRLLAPTRAGEDLGLLSEAGLPGVADPGAALVGAAHDAGLEVVALSGPSALTLALAASGLNGQSFVFLGYLPVDGAARRTRLREIESASRRLAQTQVFIETPYRNAALMQSALETLEPQTRLGVSCGLTLPGGWSRTRTVAAWRSGPVDLPDRTPAVFSLLAR